MNIGDLFFTLRGDGARLQADAKAQGVKAGDTAGSGFAASFKKSFSGANIGKGLVQGLGLAGALGAVNLVSNAVSTFTDVLQDSVKAALADEESQNRLAASLRTNVPNWDGNTEAIEANILAKQRLGFEDEQLRDSLTILVGATHDVTKAQEIMNTAMDLSRFKGIDLKTASEALIKVEGGVYRSLKGLGIVLRDGATQTEALAAVQKVAAGQAEAYARTNKGKLEASQIKLGEAMENFGGTIMPAVVEVTTAASDVASDFAGNLEGVGRTAQDVAKILKDLGIGSQQAADGGFDLVHAVQDLLATGNPTKVSNTLGVLLDTIDKTGISTKSARDQLKGFGFDVETVTDRVGNDANDMSAAARTAFSQMQDDIADTRDEAVDFRTKFRDAAGAVIRSAHRIVTALAADAQALIDGYYDPIETRAALHDTRLQLFADQEALRVAGSIKDAKERKEAIRQASDDIVKDLDDEATGLAELGAQHKLTATDVARYAKDARSQYGSMSKDAIADTEAIIQKLEALAGLHPKVNITIDAQLSPAAKKALQALTHHAAGHGPTEFGAEGGRFPAGTDLVVGEKGWERMTLLPGGGAVVTDHARSVLPDAGRLASAAGVKALEPVGAAAGGDTIHVNLLDRTPVTSVQDTGDRLRMLERRGYLRRRR